MSISLDFHLLGVRLGGLEIKVDEGTDKTLPALPAVGAVADRTVKWFSRKWTDRLFR